MGPKWIVPPPNNRTEDFRIDRGRLLIVVNVGYQVEYYDEYIVVASMTNWPQWPTSTVTKV